MAFRRNDKRRLWVGTSVRIFCGVLAVFLCMAIGLRGHVEGAVDGDNDGASVLPACLIGLDLKEPGYALVVEKASQTLRVYRWDNGFSLKHTFPC